MTSDRPTPRWSTKTRSRVCATSVSRKSANPYFGPDVIEQPGPPQVTNTAPADVGPPCGSTSTWMFTIRPSGWRRSSGTGTVPHRKRGSSSHGASPAAGAGAERRRAALGAGAGAPAQPPGRLPSQGSREGSPGGAAAAGVATIARTRTVRPNARASIIATPRSVSPASISREGRDV